MGEYLDGGLHFGGTIRSLQRLLLLRSSMEKSLVLPANEKVSPMKYRSTAQQLPK
jgi:hypothetical protein